MSNSEDEIKGKKPPQIQVDPITGKVTIIEENFSSETNQDNKKSSQSRKRLIEPDDKDGLEEQEKDKKKSIFLSLTQRVLGNQARNVSSRNLDIAQNIGERLNKLGVKFLGHISAAKSSELSPNSQVGAEVKDKTKDNERNL